MIKIPVHIKEAVKEQLKKDIDDYFNMLAEMDDEPLPEDASVEQRTKDVAIFLHVRHSDKI